MWSNFLVVVNLDISGHSVISFRMTWLFDRATLDGTHCRERRSSARELTYTSGSGYT
ncbi:hypothetical protein [Aerosakkonema funiforme]|uniref:Uncharacterized protein n=1 Tax=Aerosakkonema funiforme FACHB-1375 TaxID=2949571 RepID=A0A926VKB1_9CYAN|nr:hypothetical protein [Aerosakkonema funiforme]MBD2185386.1 hypothetical protein [Aerosakkonema funiforme FACHB-1375]